MTSLLSWSIHLFQNHGLHKRGNPYAFVLDTLLQVKPACSAITTESLLNIQGSIYIDIQL